jgi:Holliday junction resolvase-like predicted endonuclease
MKKNRCYDVKSRFDVVAIALDDDKENIEVIKNAFDLVYG